MKERVFIQLVETWGTNKVVEVFAFAIGTAILAGGIAVVVIPDRPEV